MMNKPKVCKFKEMIISNWFFYGVLFSLFPVFIAIAIDWYFNFTFLQIFERHFLDFVLVTFAIGVNLHSLAEGQKIGTNPQKMAFISVLVCAIYYSLSYGLSTAKNLGVLSSEEFVANKYAVWVVRVLILIFCCSIIYAGSKLEKCLHQGTEDKQESSS